MTGEGAGIGEGDALSRFEGFGRVILVANSDAVDIADLQARHAGALFVFFNKVYKVLDRPLLRRRASRPRARDLPAPNIVYRREVADVLRLVSGPRFWGVVNLRVGAAERFSPAEAFEGAEAAHLDLQPMFAGFYPPTHVPTSGFALALALAERLGPGRVMLAGFTARRSEAWKLFHDHDWTFEQVAMRALARSGLIAMEPGRGERSPFDVLCERFPAVSRDTVALDRRGGARRAAGGHQHGRRPAGVGDEAAGAGGPGAAGDEAEDAQSEAGGDGWGLTRGVLG